MVYVAKGPKFVHKRHLNRIKKRHSNIEENNRPKEELMDTMFDTFDMSSPQTAPEVKRLPKRKQRAIEMI